MSDIEYCVFFAKAKSTERHHMLKSIDPQLALLKAWHLLKEMRRQGSGHHRRHSGWSTHVEVWEIRPGDHGFSDGSDGREIWNPTYPDRLVALAPWTDKFITITASDVTTYKVREYLNEMGVVYAFTWGES